jgi:hypothetical protein
LKDVRDTVSTHWAASGVSEYCCVVGFGVGDFTQCRGRFWPERTEALFLAFAEEAHLQRLIEGKRQTKRMVGIFAAQAAGVRSAMR